MKMVSRTIFFYQEHLLFYQPMNPKSGMENMGMIIVNIGTDIE